MPAAKDLKGQRFGRLVVTGRVGSNKFGKALWQCDCDCGTKGYDATQNMLARGVTQSCGCLRQEFLTLGPMRAHVPSLTPRVQVTYPIPENLHPHPLVNDVLRRRFQMRWERVEMEVRAIQRGKWKEPEPKKPFVPKDQHDNPIMPIDLRALAEKKRREWRTHCAMPIPDVPSSVTVGSSLADRIRVVTDEEWARL